ncbi:scavenger receptor cysteine-rich type 1 protein M130-like [Poecilia formosa]|uniref:scavenger receptor cysteine-rich type 1 protein M130-like n=1 Tax=Poecilia formosa TaxID=48698 RepID=UPI0007B7CBFA|nr:PREDICTED: scavenger receptor cysteine-rich type 1 protein M130-like [Poecilia formosa]
MWNRKHGNLQLFTGFIFTFVLTSTFSTGQIRLAGRGSTRCSGRVEVYYRYSWGTVCDDNWDIADAKVVCRQLDCGPAISAVGSARFGEGFGQIWLHGVQCSGYESSLISCSHRSYGRHNCRHSGDAGVICSDNLPKPSISISSAEVTWGQQVSITCSMAATTFTSFSSGILLLVLLVSLAVCLGCRRKLCSKRPIPSDQNQIKKLEMDKESTSDDDPDYEEADPDLRQISVGVKDYAASEQRSEEDEESTDEDVYVNVDAIWKDNEILVICNRFPVPSVYVCLWVVCS